METWSYSHQTIQSIFYSLCRRKHSHTYFLTSRRKVPEFSPSISFKQWCNRNTNFAKRKWIEPPKENIFIMFPLGHKMCFMVPTESQRHITHNVHDHEVGASQAPDPACTHIWELGQHVCLCKSTIEDRVLNRVHSPVRSNKHT